jgi:hypothetical protein
MIIFNVIGGWAKHTSIKTPKEKCVRFIYGGRNQNNSCWGAGLTGKGQEKTFSSDRTVLYFGRNTIRLHACDLCTSLTVKDIF